MTPAQRLQSSLDNLQNELQESWPEILPFVSHHDDFKSINDHALNGSLNNDEQAISTEELEHVSQQLRAIGALPAGTLDDGTVSDLSHKLSFIFKQPVQFSVDGMMLTHTFGALCTDDTPSMQRTKFWSAEPTDQAATNLSADSDSWSVFVSPINIPLEVRSEWKKPWFLEKRVLLINPTTMVAVSARIAGVLSGRYSRYQLGAHQSVIRAGSFWSPANRGRAIVCFAGQSLPLGKIINMNEVSIIS